jgi:hypothetical protein
MAKGGELKGGQGTPEVGHDGELIGSGDEHVLHVQQLGNAQTGGRAEGDVQILLLVSCRGEKYKKYQKKKNELMHLAVLVTSNHAQNGAEKSIGRLRGGGTFLQFFVVDKARPVFVYEGTKGEPVRPARGEVAYVNPRIARHRALTPTGRGRTSAYRNMAHIHMHGTILRSSVSFPYQSRSASWPRTVAMSVVVVSLFCLQSDILHAKNARYSAAEMKIFFSFAFSFSSADISVRYSPWSGKIVTINHRRRSNGANVEQG